MSVRLRNWQQESSPATRNGAIKNNTSLKPPLLHPRELQHPLATTSHIQIYKKKTLTHAHTHTLAQPALFEMFVLLMCCTSGRIRLNARRPQTLRSVVLIRTNHSPSLAEAELGVRRERTRETGSERVRMSDGEERERECRMEEERA